MGALFFEACLFEDQGSFQGVGFTSAFSHPKKHDSALCDSEEMEFDWFKN